MKKMILGLLMTVGISSFALANDIAEDTSQMILLEGTCYHQTVTTYYDTCGRAVGQVFSPMVTVPCSSGQPDYSATSTPVKVVIPPTTPCPPSTGIA